MPPCAKSEKCARRILAAYGRSKADRIPICPPIGWHPMRDIEKEKPGGWRDDPDFVRVARLVEEYCDFVPPYNAVKYPAVFSPISYQRFLEAPAEFIEVRPAERVGPTRSRHTTVLHTPKGDLFWTYLEDDGIETRWDVVKPIREPADVEKMLSVPYTFDPPPAAAFEPFRRHRAEMGVLCTGGAGVNSMVAMLVGMMPYQQVLEWMLTERGLVRALADAWLERVREKVSYLLEQGVGPFWHFNGVERACPPMMGPRQWEEWVLPYDGTIMKLIKERDPSSIIHVHCHGRVRGLLPLFLEMGVDSVDPVEPPPQGDIEFWEARSLVGERMTLYGNIEFVDMERCSRDEIELKVRSAIEQGKPRMALCASAGPHERHTPRFTANAIRYIEAGMKYGSLETGSHGG